MVKFNNSSKPKTKERKDKKWNTFDSVNALYKGRQLTLNTFGSGIFPITVTQGKRFSRTLASRPSHLARVAKVSERKVFA